MQSSQKTSTPTGSVASAPRELLFGEIDSTGAPSLRTNKSICSLTLSTSSTFLRFWLQDSVRERLLACLEKEDLGRMRRVCNDFSNRAAPALFGHLIVNFRSSTFSRPARLAALERIGRHVKTLTFSFPHSDATALPPLIDPVTGEEQKLTYTPQIKPSSPDRSRHPKFGSWEIADLLVKQYPPIFHAATNVASFIRAFGCLYNLQHLKISCPSTQQLQSVRRSTVDYALISLRIAIERAPLLRLDSLSFVPIQPSDLFYLQPLMGLGACPQSVRRWAQIRDMTVHMQSFDSDSNVRKAHLKALHAYLRNFATSLHKFYFRWEGAKGPSPVSLSTEPCLCSDTEQKRKDPDYTLSALKFTALNHMELENAVVDAAQISAFICEHRRTLEEFKFEQVQLRSGDWDEALSPLSQIAGNDEWKKKQQQETMDVPIMLSPCNLREELVDGIGVDGERIKEHDRGSKTLSSWLSKVSSKQGRRRTREHLQQLKNTVFSWR